ncbi:MAG: NERD domain-containing protein [Lentisphaeria bacterium]|nr:NERD domain-containing protein [Lentisphaeria bacterium]
MGEKNNSTELVQKQLIEDIVKSVLKEWGIQPQKSDPEPPQKTVCPPDEKVVEIQKSRTYKKVFEFFQTCGYTITEITEKSKLAKEYTALATQIFNYNSVIFPLIQQMQKTEKGVLALAHIGAAEEINKIRNILNNFERRNWFKFSNYNKTTHEISFERLPEYKSYAKSFTGGIFGEYVTVKFIEKALQGFAKERHGFKYKLFHDIKLKDPNTGKQVDMQLDLVVQCPENFYIFETKMGATLAIDKWVDRHRLFTTDKNKFITCCADENLNPQIFKPFRLFNLKNLTEQFIQVLKNDYQE